MSATVTTTDYVAKPTTKQQTANAVKATGSVLHTGVYAIAEGIKYATAFAVNSIDNTQSRGDVRAEIQATSELRMAKLEDKIAAMRAKAQQTK